LFGFGAPVAYGAPPIVHAAPESFASEAASVPLLEPESLPLLDPESTPLLEPELSPVVESCPPPPSPGVASLVASGPASEVAM
jgi:hypothetical protein